jgi:predicted DNA-binding transcriptional regulator YafY
MRAGRLLRLVMILQDGRRHTAGDLAGDLHVSQRTVLRDLDTLSTAGIPVYATRGPHGGFQLLDTFERSVTELPPGLTATRGRLRRVRIRLAPGALRIALVNGKPEGWRPRPDPTPVEDRPDWLEGSFRFDSYDSAILELLSLGPDVEVLLPVELRETMATIGHRLARVNGPSRPAARHRTGVRAPLVL